LEISKVTVTNYFVSGSSGSGDPVLWELRGERVKIYLVRSCFLWLRWCAIVIFGHINWFLPRKHLC